MRRTQPVTHSLLALHAFPHCLQYGQTSGLLEYIPPEGGAKTKITFAAADAIQLQPMRTGDHVCFRIATNLQVWHRERWGLLAGQTSVRLPL